METILQFGTGNFLRAFVDTFVSEMNAAGQNVGKIVVVQSTGESQARQINAQNGRFHIVVRGIEGGAPVDRIQVIDSLSRALAAKTEWERVVDVACAPSLRAVVSNTTEAGFALDDADTHSDETAPRSFPAKLLTLLRARFEAGESGLTILPCELIPENGDRLHELVREQAERWQWTERTFSTYIDLDCAWINSLVDRIASGRPEVHPLLSEDALLTVTEPYAFWAVEDRPETAWLYHPAIRLVADVAPYTLRKLRILNGAHTALVAHVQQLGRTDLTFVREAVADREIAAWLHGLLFEEIVPTIADAVPDAHGYAVAVLERFANPYLDHKLSDIAVNQAGKMAIRLVPTAEEYREKFGREAKRLREVVA